MKSSESKMAVSTGPIQGENALKRAFDLFVRKTQGNIKQLADSPKSAAWATDGNYFAHKEGFYEIGNWTSSFFTGMALLAWRETEDEYFLQQALRLAPAYRKKVFTHFIDTHHDLGFLYMLYSVALYKLTGGREHRETGLRAAEILYHRFNQKAGFIRAWGHANTAEQDNLAIIDCMMNLPLLYWAATELGDRKYHDAANDHARVTLKYFIRPDDSVYHAYRFDLKSGQAIRGDNYCGRSLDSHWARGTAWAIYGFALSYRYTGNEKYLDASVRLARKFIQGSEWRRNPRLGLQIRRRRKARARFLRGRGGRLRLSGVGKNRRGGRANPPDEKVTAGTIVRRHVSESGTLLLRRFAKWPGRH